jgi:hypothetical protein
VQTHMRERAEHVGENLHSFHGCKANGV